MRILMIVHGLPPKAPWGTEWYSLQVARELSNRHQVFVFARGEDGEYLEHTEREQGFEVRKIDTPRERNDFQNHILDARVALSLSEFLEEVRPDVADVQHCFRLGLSVIDVLLQREIPTIIHLHDFYFMCHRIHLLKPGLKRCPGPKTQEHCAECIIASYPYMGRTDSGAAGLEYYQYSSNLLRSADCLVAPSKFVKRMFESNFPSIGPIIVSPLGVDLSYLSGLKKKDSKKLVFGYFGIVAPHKGVHVLVNAFNDIRDSDVELRIFGASDPDYLNELVKSADPEKTIFAGAYGHDQLAEVLSQIDVFVMPSTCYESYSFTIREAFAAGIPVIVPDIGAQAEAVKDGVNGLHFRSDDSNDLREKIDMITQNRNLIEHLKENVMKTHVTGLKEHVAELESTYGVLGNRRKDTRKNLTSAAYPSGSVLANTLKYIRRLEEKNRALIQRLDITVNELNEAIRTRNEEIGHLKDRIDSLIGEIGMKTLQLQEKERILAESKALINTLENKFERTKQELRAIYRTKAYKLYARSRRYIPRQILLILGIRPAEPDEVGCT